MQIAESLRVTHVVRQYPPGIGGIENFVASLAERQVGEGHQVSVVTLNRIFDAKQSIVPTNEFRNGVKITRIGFLGWRRYPFAPAVLRHLSGSDIVHVHGLEFFADYLGWTRWIHRKPLVISTHGGFFHTPFAGRVKRIWFRSVTRVTLRRYGAVLASSVQDAETFRAIAPKSVTLIENAVDTGKFEGTCSRTGTTMIYFGRLAPNKGLPRLLHWFAKLHAAVPNWRLIIAGKEMGVKITDLRAIASAEKITDAVEFHSSPSDADLSGLIHRSRVYVCASTYEGFGLAAVEGIAAGLYPLLSLIPTFQRTIQRVGVGTAIDFSSQIEVDRFLGDLDAFDIDDRQRLAAKEALPSFGWATVLEAVEKKYRQVLDAQPPDRELAALVARKTRGESS